jgi:hypothetical protein
VASIPVAEITAGMVASEDVCGPGGRVFLPKGTVIGDRHLLALRALGVTSIRARNADEESRQSSTPAAVLQALHAGLAVRFRHNDPGHPAVKELMRIALLRRARARMG